MGTGTCNSMLMLRLSTAALLVFCMTLPMAPRAQESGGQQLARELGSALAWRLGAATVEEKCRAFDPDGNGVRAQALKNWQQKNAALIAAVDSRVAEVVAVVYPDKKIDDAVVDVREQVKGILVDALLADKKPEEIKTLCAAEADPARPRWTSNGMPHVQESLAALYDWLVQNRGTPPEQPGS